MIKMDARYSPYVDNTDPEYPEGKAVDTSGLEEFDGTPIRAAMVNDFLGAMQAIHHDAYGTEKEVSGENERVGHSDVVDGIKKIIDKKMDGNIVDSNHLDSDLIFQGTPTGNFMGNFRGNLRGTFEGTIRNFVNMIYPVGSLYWTSKSPENDGDPNNLFGGTWKRVKDKFILAAGDSYAAGASGGKASETISILEKNLPSHTHSFDGGGLSGTANIYHKHYIAGNTGEAGADHTHGGNTADGGVTGTLYTLDNTTIQSFTKDDTGAFTSSKMPDSIRAYDRSTEWNGWVKKHDFNGTHSHSLSTGAASANHSHSIANFTNSRIYNDAGAEIGGQNDNKTWNVPLAGSISGSISKTGGGEAVAIDTMPPYEVKYCWERIA